ncbi:penicillin-binding protein 2 [Guyparkeria sp. SB14A]|uniref:penicillin-binding protein 2 n=1 Tax=Guyparkeria sp. SB14A TaxID=2571147 RepID=UPI0010ACEE31|nr:penicillin-binding protein 2 [Guyparkeria sp. SB14A]TKA90067.1 penicillin-binding protein 2 [Guyparkeria sp. SB14A]
MLDRLHDHGRARRVFRLRILFAALVSLVVVLTLLGRAAWLQIAQHEHYLAKAEQNRTRLVVVPPERGRIFDAQGEVVADNVATYQVQITPEHSRDVAAELAMLADVLRLDARAVEALEERIRVSRRFDPVLVKADLDEVERARLARLKPWLPGTEIVSSLKRVYPYRELLAHVVGYVGRINAEDVKRLDPDAYQGTQYVGKTGIERQYEDRLHGQPGYRIVEVDALGREVKVLETQRPVPGEDIALTIDVGLQGVAAAALGEYAGAVVAQDPRDGAIRAMVSRPSFDPNLFVDGISHQAYRDLLEDPDRPLYNRATTATYPPGSTIKPVMGLAGMEYGLLDPDERFFAGPYYQIPGNDHRYRDWRKWGHGWVDFEESVFRSVDVYYYDLAYRMGIDRMHEFFTRFGLGQQTGIDLPGERAGLMPSRDWKQRVKQQVWFPGETVIAGIGQGYMLSTILQLADMTSTLALSGVRHVPWLVADDREPQPRLTLSSESYWQRAREAMRAVVGHERGTAHKIEAPYPIAGKTGTAQVFSVAQDEEYDAEELERRLHDHALFVGFAPFDDPELSVAVIAEHGGSGSGTAAPIARQVMDFWFDVEPDADVQPEFSEYGD